VERLSRPGSTVLDLNHLPGILNCALSLMSGDPSHIGRRKFAEIVHSLDLWQFKTRLRNVRHLRREYCAILHDVRDGIIDAFAGTLSFEKLRLGPDDFSDRLSDIAWHPPRWAAAGWASSASEYVSR